MKQTKVINQIRKKKRKIENSESSGASNNCNIVEPIRSKKDIRKLVEWFKNYNIAYAVLFILGINSGLRISDILSLDVGDVTGKDFVTIREQKTQKYKKFPIKDEVKSMLVSYCAGKDLKEPLFVSKRGIRLDRTQVYRVIKQACEELGITANVGTHTMRKTFGYHHYKQFKDIAILQAIFNHSSPEVTKRYIGITQDEVNNSYMLLNLFDSPEETSVEKAKESSRKKATRIISYLRNYLKNGGLRHREFALDCLEVVGCKTAS
jgi:integrase